MDSINNIINAAEKLVPESLPRFDTHEVESANLMGSVLRNTDALTERFRLEEPAIAANETFIPQDEVADILGLPSSDRPAALAEVKEKLSYMYEQSAEVQLSVLKAVSENPQLTVNEIEALAMQELGGLANNPEVVSKVQVAMQNLQTRRTAMDDLYAKSETTEELFNNLFGKNPAGEVEIIRTPIGLVVVCGNAEDLKYVCDESYSKFGSFTVDSQLYLGKLIRQTKQPGLDFGVIAMGSEDITKYGDFGAKRVVEHETQHSLNWLMVDLSPFNLEEMHDPNEIANEMRKVADSPWLEGGETQAYTLLRQIRSDVVNLRERDEIFAYLANGLPANEIKQLLGPGGIYDFRGKLAARVSEQAHVAFPRISEGGTELDQDYAFMYPTVINKVFGEEYEQIQTRSYEAVQTLQMKGYSNAEIIFMLQHHPMETWNKVSRRI